MARTLNTITLSLLRRGEKGEDAYSVDLAPSEIILTEGKAKVSDICVRVRQGDSEILFANQAGPGKFAASSLTVAAPLSWSFRTDKDGLFYYRIQYSGSGAVDASPEAIVTLPDGSTRRRTISIRTISEPYAVELSQSSIVFNEGEKGSVWVTVNVRQGQRIIPNKNVAPSGVTGFDAATLTVAAPLSWSFRTDKNDDFQYRIMYSGSGPVAPTDIPVVITLPDGSTVTKLLRVLTVPKGKTYKPVRVRYWDAIHDHPNEGCELYPGDGENDPWTDVVLQRTSTGDDIYYKCIKACTKAKDTHPDDPQYEGYLLRSSQYEIIATKVLLAKNAVIDLLASNGISIYDKSGTLVGEITGTGEGKLPYPIWIGNALGNTAGINAKIPLWAVDKQGRHIIGGIGRHIELDPISKEMRIYESKDSVVASHSGKTLDYKTVVPSATSSEADSGSVAAGFTTVSAQGTSSKEVILDHTTAVTGSGVLEVSIPAYTLTAKANGKSTATGGTGPGNIDPSTDASLSVAVYINGTQVGSSAELGQVSTGATTTGSTSGQATKTTEAKTMRARVNKGDKYRVVVTLGATITGGTASGGSVSATSTGTVAAHVATDCYNAEYAANGYIISQNSDNYIYFLFDKGILHAKCVANGKTLFSTE